MSSSGSGKKRGSGDPNKEESETKKPRLEEASEGDDPGVSDVPSGSGKGGSKKKRGVGSESDEEFTIESGESDEEGFSDIDSEGDSSDIVEEEEEEGDEGGTSIIIGQQVTLKDVGDGKYRLRCEQGGKELKMVVSEQDTKNAASSLKEKKNSIPLFEISGVDIAKDDEYELLVYGNKLSLSSDEFPLADENTDQNKDSEEEDGFLKGRDWCALKIENVSGTFATQDLTVDD